MPDVEAAPLTSTSPIATGETPDKTPVLMMRAITKRFPGVLALSDVNFTVYPGEVHVLVGENGAGKSTLMKILSGVYAEYEGRLELDGNLVRLRSPRDAQKHGIAMIHQDLQQVPELSVYENLFLGREYHGFLGGLDRQGMRADARKWLGNLGLDIDCDRPVKSLRVAERQLLEIAKALSLQAHVLIMDEPTSALSSEEVSQLFTVIRKLRSEGVAIIYISHRLDEIFTIADRITVLRDGRLVASLPANEMDRPKLISLMVGRELTELFPTEERQAGVELLRVENISVTRGRRPLKDIGFTVRAGEIVGLAGLLGAGRTELLETLYGVPNPKSVQGRISVRGRLVRFASPRHAIGAGISFVTEDRKGQSLVLVRSVRENTSLVGLKRFLRGLFLNLRQEQNSVEELVRNLRIKTPGIEALVAQLSGGNQQKVVLAKFLLVEPSIILLDEPTQGIDIGAKAEIYTLINSLARAGAGVVLASSEMPELLALCDRILVLCEGRVAGELTRGEATQEKILELATRFHIAEVATPVTAA
ncbi:MAG: sugar ABC transporter ATP-binding protein [Chloroflexota bacterium]